MAGIVVVIGLVSMAACRAYLLLAERRGWGQPVRSDGPQAHLAKKGTPTMGGIAFMPVALGTALVGVVWRFDNGAVGVAVLVAGLGMALIGLWDDATKVIGGKPTGVKARWRLIAQFVVATAAVALMHHADAMGTGAPSAGWLGAWPLGTVASSAIQVLILVGCVNAVNFTDGVDGLAAGTVAIAALGLAFSLPALTAAGVAMPVLAGACLGFLVYNRHPAKVFMGDVGSMGIGGMLAAAAVALRIEFAFLLLGAIFWLEMASVIAQVISFKLTGKRVLKMAPLHHHLELSGWSEKKIVRVAYAVQVLLSVATVALVWAVAL
jgi:phospho-N-acetylmuramoyl-pentapeptide-transferase